MNTYKDMIGFKNVFSLCDYIVEKSEEELISIIANKHIILDIMYVLIADYSGFEIEYCDIDFDSAYDKEYYLSIFRDEDIDICNISIGKAYNEDKSSYFGMDGYIMFHEDANSKALRDILNNHYSEVADYDWFVLGEDDADEPVENDDTDKKPTASKSVYKVNGKECSKEEFDKRYEKFEEMYFDNVKNILLGYCSFMDDVNEWSSRLLRW